MLLVAGRNRIVPRRYGIGVAPLPIPALDAHLSAPEVADGFLGSLLGLALGPVHAAGTAGATLLHSPVVAVPEKDLSPEDRKVIQSVIDGFRNRKKDP